MKSIKYILATVLTVFATAGFTSCSDDDDYSVGQASEGAYFPDGLATSVRASKKTTVYEVPVYRTSKDAPSTYTVSSNLFPATDGITIPSSVSFSGDATSTTLPITYDPDVVDQSQVYSIVLKLDNASSYGKSELSFEFQVASPLQTVVWDGSIPEGQSADGTTWPAVQGTCTGTCTYFYDTVGFGTDPGLPIYKVYDEDNPHSYELVVQHWAYDLPLTITVPDDRVRDDSGNLIVRLYGNDFGADILNGGYANTWVADDTYYYEYRGWDDEPEECTFDAESGMITIPIWYYVPALGAIAYGYDYIQLAGYPDYTISVTYQGLYTNTDDLTYAIGLFTAGSDVKTVKAALVATDDQYTALSYVLSGGEDVVDITPGTDIRELFRVKEAGTYILVVVSYDSTGTPQKCAFAEVNVNIDLDPDVYDPADWNELGTGSLADGWILPLALSEDADYTEYAFDVTISQNKENPNLYIMLQPFGSSYLLTQAGYNECSKKRNIKFTVDGDYVEVLPQASGFASSYIIGPEIMVMNYEGYVAYMNADTELTADEVHFILNRAGVSYTEIDEDGVISIPYSPFGVAGYDFEDYLWGTDETTYIVMPSEDGGEDGGEDAASVRRRTNAKALAHPQFKSLSQMSAMKAVAIAANKKASLKVSALKVSNDPVCPKKLKSSKSIRTLMKKR